MNIYTRKTNKEEGDYQQDKITYEKSSYNGNKISDGKGSLIWGVENKEKEKSKDLKKFKKKKKKILLISKKNKWHK